MRHSITRLLTIVALAQLLAGPAPASSEEQEPSPIELEVGERLLDLDYPYPTSVRRIYRQLGRDAGLNVLFGAALLDQPIHLELFQVTPLEALETLAREARHIYKVVQSRSVVILEDTPVNRRPYGGPSLLEEADLLQPPAHRLSFAFSDPISVLEVYRWLAREADLKVAFDADLRDMQTTFELTKVTPLEALEIVMKMSGHFYRRTGDDTLVIITDTPRKRMEYR